MLPQRFKQPWSHFFCFGDAILKHTEVSKQEDALKRTGEHLPTHKTCGIRLRFFPQIRLAKNRGPKRMVLSNDLFFPQTVYCWVWPPWCWLVWSASWALKWSCLPLSPVVSLHVGGGCWLVWSASWLWSGGGWVLVWSASWALKWSCLPLSPIVSGCLPSCGGVGVGWCGRHLRLWSGLVSRCLPSCGGWVLLLWSASWALKWSCLPLSPVVSLHVGGGCWLVWSASWALKWSYLGGGCWLVWPHLEQKHSEIKITGFNLNLLTVNCLGSTLG